jgi:hypothetical protein
MRLTQIVFRTLALSSLFAGALAQAATVSGTVTNQTTGKPASGDTVILVDVQAGMGEVAKATTDAQGHYTINLPGSGPYLIRAMHQGAGYFIAAPQGGAEGNISVYDVAAKVQGVFIEADVIEVETENGQLRVNERLFVHNTSSPPTTQWSKRAFSVVLPEDATVNEVGAQRPGGLPTSMKLNPDGPRGRYSFDFPIQPDKGDKDTLFQVSYNLPYSSAKYDFKSVVTLPADNFAVLLPKSMTFNAGAGQNFRSVQEDPGVQTFILKNAAADKPIAFTVSGTGSMPREEQGAQGGGQGATAAGGQPGGGIGAPINTPDPLSKYKWWILGGLALLLTAGAAFLLRKPAGAPAPAFAGGTSSLPSVHSPSAAYQPAMSSAGKNSALLSALKDELFAVESEKIAGTLSPDEYARVKTALETVLARALKRNA